MFSNINKSAFKITALKKYYTDKLYRNSISFMLNSLLASFYGILFWMIAARLMSASDIGVTTVTISVATMIVNLSRLGLDIGLMRYMPASEDKISMYNTVLILTLALSLLFAIVYLVGIDYFSPAQKFLRDGLTSLIFIGYIAIVSISTSQNSAITALRRADLLLVQNSLLGIRIPLLFVMATLGFTGIFLSYNIAYIVAILVGVIILLKYNITVSPEIRLSSIKDSFKFSFGNYVAGIISIAPTTILPILIINDLGAAQSAYFFVAYSIASILFTIPTAISTSLFVEGSHELPLRDNAIKSTKFMLLTLIPTVLVVVVFGNNILSLFNKEYAQNSLNMLILMAISSIFTIIPQIFLTIKKVQKEIMMVNLVILANMSLIIILGYILLLKYGLIGIGYAWLIANVIVSIGILYYVFRHEKWV